NYQVQQRHGRISTRARGNFPCAGLARPRPSTLCVPDRCNAELGGACGDLLDPWHSFRFGVLRLRIGIEISRYHVEILELLLNVADSTQGHQCKSKPRCTQTKG